MLLEDEFHQIKAINNDNSNNKVYDPGNGSSNVGQQRKYQMSTKLCPEHNQSQLVLPEKVMEEIKGNDGFVF